MIDVIRVVAVGCCDAYTCVVVDVGDGSVVFVGYVRIQVCVVVVINIIIIIMNDIIII